MSRINHISRLSGIVGITSLSHFKMSLFALLVLMLTAFALTGCGSQNQTGAGEAAAAETAVATGEESSERPDEAGNEEGNTETETMIDQSTMSAEALEESYTYRSAFLPEKDLFAQPYAGDTMPYYEDGVFYIYYLKDGGDSLNHSIYLVTTKDFVDYEEVPEPILQASEDVNAQDNWTGTGSVVKIDDTYYLFYTGHGSSESLEYKEKILLAKGSDLYHFEKVEGWEIIPDEEIGQKNDFRDPQAYYNEETGRVEMTVTAAIDGTARILKYSLAGDLTDPKYEGVIFTNKDVVCWNLECSDTFCIDGTWYLTYSAQDDTLWYASSDSQYGPYSDAKRLDGLLYYSSKHVEEGENAYMVGWVRRSAPPLAHNYLAWAGNIYAQKIVKKANGDLTLAPIDAMVDQMTTQVPMLLGETEVNFEAGSDSTSQDAFSCKERFVIKGQFEYSDTGRFGLYFDHEEKGNGIAIAVNPEKNRLELCVQDGKIMITEKEIELKAGENYSFTYVQEGSVGAFYIDGEDVLTVRVYGMTGRTIQLFAENNTVAFSGLSQME